MDWDKLRVFQAAAEAGSFTHAGERLHLSQSAVSRQISSLEESLNVALFHRHARGLILTEQGEVLLSTTKDVFTKLSATEALISEGRERPKGNLNLIPLIGKFSIARCVCAPHNASFGTLISPRLSVSTLVFRFLLMISYEL